MAVGNRQRELVIFATSLSPDPYINSILHSITHLNVQSVRIVVIGEPQDTNQSDGAQRATQVIQSITEQLESLAAGKYLRRSTPDAPGEVEPLRGNNAAEPYRRALQVLNRGGSSGIVVPLADLYSYLRRLSQNGQCIFDATALKKSLLVDVAATLLALDRDTVYSFELKRAPHFDQRDLFHRLRHQEDYEYRNLLASDTVRKAASRLRRWTIQSSWLAGVAGVLLLVGVVLLNARVGRDHSQWQAETLAYISLVSGAASIASLVVPFIRKHFE